MFTRFYKQVILSLSIVFLMGAFINLSAQDRTPNNGRVPNMRMQSTTPFSANSFATGDMAYGYGSISSSTLSMPMPAGTPLTLLSPFTFPNFGSTGIRGGDGNYYFLDATAPSVYQFDPGTGSLTYIGDITGMGGEQANGLAYNPVNDKYYICGGAFTVTNNLYEVDLGLLTATLVGSFPTPTGAMIDIAINSAGVGFGYDLIDDNAYTFDPVSGATVVLGPLGYDANYGQGMDIDQATGTIYLSAFNNVTVTGQLRTMDPGTGMTTLVTDWGFEQIAPFAINNDYGPIVGPGPATDPTPPNGATGVDANANLFWTNPAGATSIALWFGTTVDAMSLVYSGAPISTFDPGTMAYMTAYSWRVDETDGSGTTTGSTWHFTTMEDPSTVHAFTDDFADLSHWTIVGPLGLTNWSISASALAGGTAPELRFYYSPSFTGLSYIMSEVIPTDGITDLTIKFNHFVDWYANPMTVGCAYTLDDGATWTSIWEITPTGNVGPETVTIPGIAGNANFRLGFYFSGYSFNIDNWYVDNVDVSYSGGAEPYISIILPNNSSVWHVKSYEDITWDDNIAGNVKILLYYGGVKVKTLSNGTPSDGLFTWHIPRAFVPGDLKQYKVKIFSVDDPTVKGWSQKFKILPALAGDIAQNYPNPFNPSTVIKYSIPFQGKVNIIVYDALGQVVRQLVDAVQNAGEYDVVFDATSLASGMYFYTVEAISPDGQNNIREVKKMLFLK